MALFTSYRDSNLVKSLNKELLHKVISQQISFYKYQISKTKTNIYGEGSGSKFYDGPFLFFSLINKGKQEQSHKEEGITFNRSIEVSFILDDLIEADVRPEIGDIILFEESYYEIATSFSNQFFGGKNPKYPNVNTEELIFDGENPLENDLEEFGKNISIVVKANYVPADKVGISPFKERI